MSQPDELPDDLIDTTTAARIASAHINSVVRWILSGRLPAWRFGRKYKVSRAAVVKLLQPVRVEEKPDGSPIGHRKPGRKPSAAEAKREKERQEWIERESRAAGFRK